MYKYWWLCLLWDHCGRLSLFSPTPASMRWAALSDETVLMTRGTDLQLPAPMYHPP